MLTSAFRAGTIDRAVKTFAQSLIVLWGADAGFNVLTVDLRAAFGIALGASLLSVLTSLASAPFGDKGTSSFLPGGH